MAKRKSKSKPAAIERDVLDALRVKFANRVDAVQSMFAALEHEQYRRSRRLRQALYDLLADGLMAFVDEMSFVLKYGRVATLSDQLERDWRPPEA